MIEILIVPATVLMAFVWAYIEHKLDRKKKNI